MQLLHILSQNLNADLAYSPVARERRGFSFLAPHANVFLDCFLNGESVSENPFVQEEAGRIHITDAGYELLRDIVTDSYGNVYVFTKNADPVMVAAAMARLSRNPHDLRKTFLREFAHTKGGEQAGAFFERVLAGYGDDSVAQLLTLQVVVELASNILTKLLEWGRLAAYLEQSTRYIFFDQRDDDGNFRFYTPPLSVRCVTRYRAAMDSVFSSYSRVVRGVTEHVRQKKKKDDSFDAGLHTAWLGATRAQACDAARPMLPAATTSTVGIVASAQSIERLILFLASQDLHECQEVAKMLLREVRKVASPFFTKTDSPDRGGAMIVYQKDTREAMRCHVAALLRDPKPWDGTIVQLIDFFPKDELSLVPEMLFAESEGISLPEIQEQVRHWSTKQKEDVFSDCIGKRLNRRHKPGRAIEKVHYEWEIVGDYGTFRDLQRHRMVDALEWQHLSPAYGFDVPPLIEEAGFRTEFRNAFEIAERLFDVLQREGFHEEAQYATLLGHRMRYRFIENAREAFHLHELRTGPQGHPGYRKIVQEMHQLLALRHPRLGAAMKFVNKGEDPELTRLASEIATQRKLALLESK